MEQPSVAGKPKEKHVTELAGPNDVWVSVTDASRVARRQEHTIRTWIRDGDLPVNPVRVGLNKRTRQVRLSDLAKLTPILDIDAAIATEIGQLDLVSIPRQQQQIKEEHDHVLAEQAQFRESLVAQEQAHQRELSTLRATFEERLAELKNAQEAQMAQFSMMIEEMNARFDGALTEMQTEIHQDRQATAERIDQVEATHRSEREVLQRSQTDAVQRLEAQIEKYAHEAATAVQALDTCVTKALQEGQDTHKQLQMLSDERYTETHRQLLRLQGTTAEQNAAIAQQITQLQGVAEAARAATGDAEHRLDKQNDVIQHMRRQLLEEQQAREVLASQVATLVAGKEKPKKQS